LLTKGFDGLTASDRAAFTCNKEMIDTIWGWGKEVQLNLKDYLLLAKGFMVNSLGHSTIQRQQRDFRDIVVLGSGSAS